MQVLRRLGHYVKQILENSMKTPQFPRRFAHHAMHILEKSDEAKSPWRCGQHAMQILDDKAQRLILKP